MWTAVRPPWNVPKPPADSSATSKPEPPQLSYQPPHLVLDGRGLMVDGELQASTAQSTFARLSARAGPGALLELKPDAGVDSFADVIALLGAARFESVDIAFGAKRVAWSLQGLPVETAERWLRVEAGPSTVRLSWMTYRAPEARALAGSSVELVLDDEASYAAARDWIGDEISQSNCLQAVLVPTADSEPTQLAELGALITALWPDGRTPALALGYQGQSLKGDIERVKKAASWSESPVALGCQSSFAACYARGLDTDPKLQGRIELAIQVSPVGTVWGASLRRDDLRNPEINRCLLKRAYGLRFLALRKAFEFVLPFRFGSR